MTPWHQRAVKQAKKGNGTHAIRFAEAGKYRFELRRWPREDGGAITEKSKSGEGKIIPATKARLVVQGEGEPLIKNIEPGSASIEFEMNISSEKPTTLRTMLIDENGIEMTGAYYVYIRKVN